MIYWISWWDTDARPASNPPYGVADGPGCREILGYWESGERASDDDSTEVSVCALIRAADEDAAWAVVEVEWAPAERRFCRPHSGTLSNRFPLSPWMCERVGEK